jgi:hypothetical protein
MAKFVNTDVLDGAIAVVRTATKMVALAAQPVGFADATSAALASVTMAPADFAAPYLGAVDGRRTTAAAKSGVAVSAAGTANFVALTDPGTSRLLYVTTCPAQALSLGGTVSFSAWDVEFGNPV